MVLLLYQCETNNLWCWRWSGAKKPSYTVGI